MADIDIEKVQRQLDTIFRVLEIFDDNGFPEVFVGGGWVRDVVSGVTPRDIDIFVKDYHIDNDPHMEDVLRGAFWCDPKYMPNYENSSFREDVNFVLNIPSHEVDIISVKGDMRETISKFDTSICQIAAKLVDGELVVSCTKDFESWANDGEIYRYVDLVTREAHLDKIKDKFGIAGFKLSLSDEDCSMNEMFKIDREGCVTSTAKEGGWLKDCMTRIASSIQQLLQLKLVKLLFPTKNTT